MERAATGLCVTRQLLGAAAGALIDVSGMDITTIRARVEQARVARLATVRPDGRPHVVPCCFVLSNEVLYSAVDANPKSTVALRRLDNVRAVPWAAPMLVDHYTDAATTMLEMLGVRSSNSSAALSMPPTRNAPSHSSSNLHPAGFDELMPKTIANATVDRLLHHAHVVITNGDSIRLTQATRGKGVRPLTN